MNTMKCMKLKHIYVRFVIIKVGEFFLDQNGSIEQGKTMIVKSASIQVGDGNETIVIWDELV